MNIPQQQLAEVARRFRERTAARTTHEDLIRQKRYLDADTPERVEKFLRRRGLHAPPGGVASPKEGTVSFATAPAAAGEVLERVIGSNDLVGVAFFEMGIRIARTVGRIWVDIINGKAQGYGTGFLISPRLLLTNNHVLPSTGTAAASRVEFDYQIGLGGAILPTTIFVLDPGTFFVTDKQLDFTVVAVREQSVDGKPLKTYGWNKLSEEEGKAIVAQWINIIQHPNAEPKQLGLRENQLVDMLDDFLHYRTDTAPGSSGSPLYNDRWEIVGIHHSGVPALDDHGQPLAVNGGRWQPGMGDDQRQWVYNEGVRISRILRRIRNAPLSSGQRRLCDGIFEAEPVLPEMAGEPRGEHQRVYAPPMHGVTINTDGSATWTIPVSISIKLGEPPTVSPPADTRPRDVSGDVPPDDDTTNVVEEVLSTINRRNQSTLGYDPAHLGKGLKVALPDLESYMDNDDVVTVDESKKGQERYHLKYTHFTVAVSRNRRMPIFSACTIDGKNAKKVPRSKDTWYFDPRIDRQYQIGNELYRANPFDRGHMTRREDPVWGPLPLAEQANKDTFHYTNACPQHEALNQNKETWQGLENYILENARAHDLKAIVMTGPVFSDDDREYRGVQVPAEFWKVVVIASPRKKLLATAYLLSQKSLIKDVREAVEFQYGQYKTYQVAVKTIEAKTGLIFNGLRTADQFHRADEEFACVEIGSLEELALA